MTEGIKGYVLKQIAEAIKQGTDALDSYAIARDLNTEVTYVQYVLREALHVCRYNVGAGWYRVHALEACSAICQERGSAAPKQPVWQSGNCPTCFIALPRNGECGYCA